MASRCSSRLGAISRSTRTWSERITPAFAVVPGRSTDDWPDDPEPVAADGSAEAPTR